MLVVIALRADFFGRLAAYVELADLVGPNHALLGPMSPTELRRAIQGPAERTGLEVEPALVDALVDEVAGEAGGLPLLSTALLDLWREREDHSLTLAAYARTGGVRGAIGRHAEAAFRSLSEDEQQVARRMLLRLVAGGDGEPLTRRRVTRSELDADEDERVRRVLAALVERRLLVVDDGTVELVHEALLERWQRLVDWLEEDVQGRLQHRHLTLAATEWEAGGRDPSTLYRGARLAGALDWATEHAPDLNQLERHFLDESQAASVREASRQRRTNRRLRALLVVAVALLALSALAAAFALEKRGQARRDATAAVAQRLGAQALIDPSLDRSLLLAREGMNWTTPKRPAATSLPRCSGSRTRSASSIKGATAFSTRRSVPTAVRSPSAARRQRRLLRYTHAAPDRSCTAREQRHRLLCGEIPGSLHALAFSPDARTLAVGSTTGGGVDQSAPSISSGFERMRRERARTRASAAVTADVVFAPDGRTFATGAVRRSHQPTIRSDRRPPGADRARASREHGPFPAGGSVGIRRTVASCSSPRATGDHRSSTLAPCVLLRTFDVGGVPAVSPASDQAAFGQTDGSVILLDLHTGRTTTLSGRATRQHQRSQLQPRRPHARERRSRTAPISVWNVRTRALRETLKGHSARGAGGGVQS